MLVESGILSIYQLLIKNLGKYQTLCVQRHTNLISQEEPQVYPEELHFLQNMTHAHCTNKKCLLIDMGSILYNIGKYILNRKALLSGLKSNSVLQTTWMSCTAKSFLIFERTLLIN